MRLIPSLVDSDPVVTIVPGCIGEGDSNGFAWPVCRLVGREEAVGSDISAASVAIITILPSVPAAARSESEQAQKESDRRTPLPALFNLGSGRQMGDSHAVEMLGRLAPTSMVISLPATTRAARGARP